MNDATLTKCYGLLHAKLKSKGRGKDWDDDMRDLYDLVLVPLPDEIGLKAVAECCLDSEWPPDVSVIREHARMLISEAVAIRERNTRRIEAEAQWAPMPDDVRCKLAAMGLGTGRRTVRVNTDRMEKVGE